MQQLPSEPLCALLKQIAAEQDCCMPQHVFFTEDEDSATENFSTVRLHA